jgi:hypothetical protein
VSEAISIPLKPLGFKSYGSIPHLPGSRRGPADHGLSIRQAAICTDKTRDGKDTVIVQEKLDGSCVSVAKIQGEIIPLGRAGYHAGSSPFEQHMLFEQWVYLNKKRFNHLLDEGERCVGEWLAQAHSTRYQLRHEPFVVFDIMRKVARLPVGLLSARCRENGFTIPRLLHIGDAISIEKILSRLEPSGHGAIDPVEGAVWRVERLGQVDFLGKFVRLEKVDGCYLPEVSGKDPVWNWRPQ